MGQRGVSRVRVCRHCGLKMRCTAEEIYNHARGCKRKKLAA